MSTFNHQTNLEFLKELYLLNCEDGEFYKQNSVIRRRILIKVFFERLAAQKNSFCNAIKILILSRIDSHERDTTCFDIQFKDINTLIFKLYKKECLQECKKREMNALKTYNQILEKTEDEEIKTSLAPHVEEIQLILREMRVMGVDKYLI